MQKFSGSLYSMMTNVAFKWDNFMCEKIKQDQQMVIMGQEIQHKDSFIQIIDNLIWFSYRSNINFEGKIISDQGWGCLIRVAQMMIANALMRQCDILNIKTNKQKILSLFADNEQFFIQSPFSIQQIIKKGQYEYQIKIGDWYTGPKIMCIMEELNQQRGNYKQMEIVNFFEQCVFENKIDLKFKHPQLIIVHAIIGDKISDTVELLKKHMRISQFAGAIVGKNNKAFFLFGYQENNAIYMDPHYVQSSDKANVDSNLKCQPIKTLTGTIALAYYFGNIQEYAHFKSQLSQIDNPIFRIIQQQFEYY